MTNRNLKHVYHYFYCRHIDLYFYFWDLRLDLRSLKIWNLAVRLDSRFEIDLKDTYQTSDVASEIWNWDSIWDLLASLVPFRHQFLNCLSPWRGLLLSLWSVVTQQPIDNDPLHNEPWYFGSISRESAEQKLDRFRGTVSYYFPSQTFPRPLLRLCDCFMDFLC